MYRFVNVSRCHTFTMQSNSFVLVAKIHLKYVNHANDIIKKQISHTKDFVYVYNKLSTDSEMRLNALLDNATWEDTL